MADIAKKIEYHTNKFMYGLGICGSVLNVYAALYSFTRGERGLYHGSAAHLAEGISVSERTVRRAYAKLFSLGLIEKCVSDDGRYSGVRCVDPKLIKKKASLESRGKSEDKSKLGECDAECVKTTEAEPEYNIMIEDELSGMPEHKRNALRMMYKYEKPGDNRRLLSFGLKGGVFMTEPQYRNLLNLLPSEELMVYLVKLENMLDENLKTGKKPPHSHYRVIKKWIEDDLAV